LTEHAHHIGSILDCFHAQNRGEYWGCLIVEAREGWRDSISTIAVGCGK